MYYWLKLNTFFFSKASQFPPNLTLNHLLFAGKCFFVSNSHIKPFKITTNSSLLVTYFSTMEPWVVKNGLLILSSVTFMEFAPKSDLGLLSTFIQPLSTLFGQTMSNKHYGVVSDKLQLLQLSYCHKYHSYHTLL